MEGIMQTQVLDEEKDKKQNADKSVASDTNLNKEAASNSNTQPSTNTTSGSGVSSGSVNKSTSKNVDIEQIKNELDKIENDYASRYPVLDDSVYNGLEYKPVEIPSETEIEKIATEQLEGYKNSNISNIQNDYYSEMASLNLKENEVQQDLQDTTNILNSERESGLAETQADNISQGIERSSIASNRQRTFNASIDRELELALNKANNEIAEISLKRGIAESEFQQAIENFDITYANKLENKISELNKEYSKKQAEALEYNDRIEKQREKLYNEWKKWADEYTSELNAKKGMDKAYYVIDQIKGLSKREAMEFLKDTDLIKALGNWYTPVVDYVQRVLN